MTCKWVANEKIVLILKQFHENFRVKTPRCRTSNHSSQMQNDALMPRDGLTLTVRGNTLDVRF